MSLLNEIVYLHHPVKRIPIEESINGKTKWLDWEMAFVTRDQEISKTIYRVSYSWQGIPLVSCFLEVFFGVSLYAWYKYNSRFPQPVIFDDEQFDDIFAQFMKEGRSSLAFHLISPEEAIRLFAKSLYEKVRSPAEFRDTFDWSQIS